jgi:membrane protease YdiL (CAAX protease family)
MGLLSLVTILALALWELLIFRSWNRAEYIRAFAFRKRKIILIMILMGLFNFTSDRDSLLALFILIVLIPVYFLRRTEFLSKTDPRRENISSAALISDGISFVIVWLYAVLITTLFARALLSGFGEEFSELGELLASATASSVALVVLIYHYAQKFSDKGFLDCIAFTRKANSKLKLVLVPAVCGLVFACGSSFIILQRKVHPPTPLGDVLENTNSPVLIGIFLLLALVIAPFVEEIAFRGYFYRLVKSIKGKRFAFVVISLTFAVLHVGQYWGDWSAIGMVAVLGFALTAMRVWTGSTIASVVMHYVYNFSVTIIPIIFLVSSNPSYFEYQAYFETLATEKKEELLLDSINRQPDFTDAYNDLAWLYAQENTNLQKGLQLIEKALAIDENNIAYLDTKAALLEKLGRVDEADLIRSRIAEISD